jgi:hypothetical protein
MLTWFGMIWNCDKFSKWNTKSNQICILSQNSYLFKVDCKIYIWHIGATINKKFQNISFENSF